jgi:hypothetical protein
MELAPCTDQIRAGCQGFSGPFPSAFLDKSLIRTGAKIKAGTELQKIIFIRMIVNALIKWPDIFIRSESAESRNICLPDLFIQGAGIPVFSRPANPRFVVNFIDSFFNL